jgi:hypothetical protein
VALTTVIAQAIHTFVANTSRFISILCCTYRAILKAPYEFGLSINGRATNHWQTGNS